MNEVSLRVAFKKNLLPTYVVTERFPFRDHRDKEYVVPEGFPTDGASFPWWLKYAGSIVMLILLALGFDGWDAFWWSIALQSIVGAPLHRAYADAAVAHDYLYWLGAPKAFADCVFFRMILRRARILRIVWLLEHRSVFARVVADVVIAYRYLRAVVMYGGVALGGFFAYAAHRRRRRAENAA